MADGKVEFWFKVTDYNSEKGFALRKWCSENGVNSPHVIRSRDGTATMLALGPEDKLKMLPTVFDWISRPVQAVPLQLVEEDS